MDLYINIEREPLYFCAAVPERSLDDVVLLCENRINIHATGYSCVYSLYIYTHLEPYIYRCWMNRPNKYTSNKEFRLVPWWPPHNNIPPVQRHFSKVYKVFIKYIFYAHIINIRYIIYRPYQPDV